MLWSIQPLYVKSEVNHANAIEKIEIKKRIWIFVRNIIWTYDVRDSGIRDKVVTANLRSWHFVFEMILHL